MSFKAYIDNIKAKTGKTPGEFKKLAAGKGVIVYEVLNPKTTIGDIVAWLKADFELGHGHAMAIVATFKGKRD